jgi:hypothetical protein
VDCETHRRGPPGNRRVHSNDHRSFVFELNRADSSDDAVNRLVRRVPHSFARNVGTDGTFTSFSFGSKETGYVPSVPTFPDQAMVEVSSIPLRTVQSTLAALCEILQSLR